MRSVASAFAAAAKLDPTAYERAYNPRAASPHFQACTDARKPANERAWRQHRFAADIPYGPHPRHRLDVYHGAGDGSRPTHLFFHGGYWRAGDKSSFGYLGAALAEAGVTAFIANYELCPDSTLDAAVASALAAFDWVMRHAGDHGGDPRRVSLSGHSAGAHLCAAILCGGAASVRPGTALAGATLLSGIYDPTPTLFTRVNSEIGLTPEVAARNNLEGRPVQLPCPVAVLAGGQEPAEWVDFSRRYAHGLESQGMRPTLHVLPNMHHFSILDEYGLPASPVRRAIATQLELPSTLR